MSGEKFKLLAVIAGTVAVAPDKREAITAAALQQMHQGCFQSANKEGVIAIQSSPAAKMSVK